MESAPNGRRHTPLWVRVGPQRKIIYRGRAALVTEGTAGVQVLDLKVGPPVDAISTFVLTVVGRTPTAAGIPMLTRYKLVT